VGCNCRYDHIFGNFKTSAGNFRRIDLIISPWEEYPFCLFGWTGSRQYLRFLRHYAKEVRGMNLNAHRCGKVGHHTRVGYSVPSLTPSDIHLLIGACLCVAVTPSCFKGGISHLLCQPGVEGSKMMNAIGIFYPWNAVYMLCTICRV
jgi:hypothetical protein